MDHANITNKASKVFHGLVKLFVADALQASSLIGMRAPVTKISIEGSAFDTTFRQSKFLSGGTITPTSGTSNFTLTGATLAGNTLRFIFRSIPLGTGSTLADGPFFDVYAEYTIQAAATLSTAATGFKAVLNNAVSGGAIVNGRLYAPDFPEVTKAQINTGVALKYAAFTGTSPNIIVNGAATGGTTQNTYNYTVTCLPKAPGIITIDVSKLPELASLDYVGASIGAALNLSATTANIDTDQSYQPLDTYLTGTAGQLTVNALQDRDPRVIQELQQIAGLASLDNYDIVAPNFYSSAPTRALIVVSDSQTFPGNAEFAVLRNIRAFNMQLGLQKAHQPVAATFELVASDTEDPLYIQTYRPSIIA